MSGSYSPALACVALLREPRSEAAGENETPAAPPRQPVRVGFEEGVAEALRLVEIGDLEQARRGLAKTRGVGFGTSSPR